MQKIVPSYNGTLRSHLVEVPQCIAECTGIRIFGRRIKSLVFSTDVAIIKNINGDAIIAVYPFTPQPSIAQAIINVSDVPVFVGESIRGPSAWWSTPLSPMRRSPRSRMLWTSR